MAHMEYLGTPKKSNGTKPQGYKLAVLDRPYTSLPASSPIAFLDSLLYEQHNSFVVQIGLKFVKMRASKKSRCPSLSWVLSPRPS